MERTPDKFARLVTYVVIVIALGAMCLGMMSCHVHYHVTIEGEHPYINRPSFNWDMITKPIHDTSLIYRFDTAALRKQMLLSEREHTASSGKFYTLNGKWCNHVPTTHFTSYNGSETKYHCFDTTWVRYAK